MTDVSYPVTLTTQDIRECAAFMAKFMKKRVGRKGRDEQQSFFVLLSAFMAANADAMEQTGFPEHEVRRIFAQATEIGINMKHQKVIPN